jgi:Thoeris protein ThsB, TIR-like domain
MSRKVFVSYAHRLDQNEADNFQNIFADKRDVFVDKSVREDIGDYAADTIKQRLSTLIQDSTVTVVLIGQETGGRSWVDWEIYHSLRKNDGVTRNGLLGVCIPNKVHWNPARLDDNVPNMGLIVDWPRDYRTLAKYIEMAYERRNGSFDLSRELRQRNSQRS